MDTTFQMLCAMCGKDAGNGSPSFDGKGHVYCQSCVKHLHGHAAHGRAPIPASCGMCFAPVQASAAAGANGRHHYCEDCLARLRGERPRRRSEPARPVAVRDIAFDQMLEDVFSTGSQEGLLAVH